MEHETKRVVSSLNPNRRVVSRLPRRVLTSVLAMAAMGSSAVAVVTSVPRTRGIAIATLVVVGIASAGRWLANRAGALSRSGKELSDYRHSESNWNPPTGMA